MRLADFSQLPLTKPEEISRKHEIAAFTCERDSLDDWLKNQALKSNSAGDSKVFVILEEGGEVIGYYAISAGSVSRKEATRKIGANAPDPVPMALIGRLAIHKNHQRQNIGSALLRDAILRIAQAAEHMGIKGIMVHALDDDSAKFYAERGFQPSKVDGHHLMISISEVTAELLSPPKTDTKVE